MNFKILKYKFSHLFYIDTYELLFSIIVIINSYNYFIHDKIQSQTCFL
jgi:hypothetical protein